MATQATLHGVGGANIVSETEVLLVIAVIAAGFVGFSAIVVALDRARVSRQKVIFLRTVAETGLAALFGSLMPILAIRLMGSEPEGWRVSAILTAMLWGFSWFSNARAYWVRGESASFAGTLYSPDNILNLAGVALLAWAAVFLPPFAGTLYCVAMTLLLVLCAVTFVARAFASVSPPAD